MVEERRSSERVAVRDTRLNSPTLCGRVINQSPGGLSIESVQALRVGGFYRFTLGDGDSSYKGVAMITVTGSRITRWEDHPLPARS